MGLIDAHAHVWTSDTAHYPLAPGFNKETMKPASFTPEELLKHAKPAGVDRVNLIQMSFYGFDNSYMLDMIKLYDGTFVGTAVIDPLGPDLPRKMDELARKKVRAFRIHPKLSQQPPEKWLRPECYVKMFAAAAKNNQALSCLVDPDGLPEIDRMCSDHTDTPIIIDHLARIGVDGTIRDKDVDALCALARHKKVMVKIGAFYALGKKKPPYEDLAPLIKRIVASFGVERCMWESDCPFQVQGEHGYEASIDLVRKKLDFVTVNEREWLLRKTAEKFFFG